MKFFEYMGKELLAGFGIAIPQGKVCYTPVEALAVMQELGRAAVVKAQVLTGKRGKAGAVRMVDGFEAAETAVRELLQMEVQGLPVEAVLVEERLAIDQELYLAITIDSTHKKPVLIASAAGGMDIEDVSEKLIVRHVVDIDLGIPIFLARDIVRQLDIATTSVLGEELARLIIQIYDAFTHLDAELVEINPVALCGEQVYAADAKITVDDASLYRQTALPSVNELTVAEKQASELGLAYVDLDGEIGIMANGAGITMATIDLISHFGKQAANFLDVGGGAKQNAVEKGLELVLAKRPRSILVNIFGGITRCDEVAQAIVRMRATQGEATPLVVRMTGTNEEQGRAVLRAANIEVCDSLQSAARRAVELAVI